MNIIVYFLNRGQGIYPYANTYLVSLLGAISSRFLGIFGIEQVLLENWFSQDFLRLSYGVGFSMVGEAFVNGGYYGGMIYIFVLGIVIGKLLQYRFNHSEFSPFKMYFAVVSLNVVVEIARGSSYLVIKEFLYGVLLTAAIIKFVETFVIKKT